MKRSFTGLFKHFGDNIAVDHIDLRVPGGSFFGLVGPNGAGTTTSLSMAVGLLRPDGGTATIFGHNIWADPVAAKALIGVLPDGMALPDRLTGREILLYLGLLRGMPREVIVERSGELLRVLELDSAEGTAVVACFTNLYGDDGSALRLTLVVPGAERADLRGRQWAWFLVVGPAGLLCWRCSRAAQWRLAARGPEILARARGVLTAA